MNYIFFFHHGFFSWFYPNDKRYYSNYDSDSDSDSESDYDSDSDSDYNEPQHYDTFTNEISVEVAPV